MTVNKQYIGDSVYVERDDEWPLMLWLTTWNGYPDDPRNKIALDPHVWAELVKYVERTCPHNEG
jgi:hypothetical protein